MKNDKIAYRIVFLIFLISFTKGTLELIGIRDTFLQLSIDILITSLFLKALIKILRTSNIIAPLFLLFSVFISIMLISFLLNSVSLIEFILFFRKYMLPVLFFYALFNLNIIEEYKNRIVRLLTILFLIQVPAAFIKLVAIGGTQEKIVGTLSVNEGSLATTMPMLAITFLIVNYLIYKKIMYPIMILFFIAIGLISNKLGILFYVGMMFILLAYFYSIKQSSKFMLINTLFIKKMSIITIILVIIFSAFVSLNPRANPENIVGGSIDLEYLSNYIDNYQNLELRGSRVEGDGRFDAPGVAYDRLERKGWIHVLLGFGPGDIIKSGFTQYENPLLMKYNIGYGGRIGLVQFMIQIGLLGVLVWTLFHLILFKKVFHIYWKYSDEKLQLYSLTVVGFIIYYFLEFYTYSSGMLKSPGVTLTYYFAIYYVMSLNVIEKNKRTREK